MAGDDDIRVRVTRVGALVISHHLEVPNLAYARAECARFEALVEEIGRPAALLMLPDRVLPPATREVIEVYRDSAERTPIAAWAAVVGGVMGFAGSIATSVAVRVFARQAVPMRVFRQLPSAVEWLAECSDLEAAPTEVLAIVEALRGGSPTTMRDVGS
jgi:hypothetical protein